MKNIVLALVIVLFSQQILAEKPSRREKCNDRNSNTIISRYRDIQSNSSQLKAKLAKIRNEKSLEKKLDDLLKQLVEVREARKAHRTPLTDEEMQRQIDAISMARSNLKAKRFQSESEEMRNLEFSVDGILDIGIRNSGHAAESAAADARAHEAFCIREQRREAGKGIAVLTDMETLPDDLAELALWPFNLISRGKYNMSLTRIEQINASVAQPASGKSSAFESVD